MKIPTEPLALLRSVNIDPAGIRQVTCIHRKAGRRLYRIVCDGGSMIIKWFADGVDSVEMRGYALLESLGVPTLPVHGRSDNALVLEDLASSGTWRLATEADSDCSAVGQAVARWYLALHEAGRKLLGGPGETLAFLRREEERLDSKTVLAMGEKLDLGHLPVWRLCADQIETLKEAIRALPETTLTYNDFHWTNLAVTRATAAPLRAVVFDYHLLGIGMAYSDSRNVLGSLRGTAAAAFKETYGPFDQRQALLDAPVSVLVALKEGLKRQRLPCWARGLIEVATNGQLENSVRRALDVI